MFDRNTGIPIVLIKAKIDALETKLPQVKLGEDIGVGNSKSELVRAIFR
jgi:hypothetical protein